MVLAPRRLPGIAVEVVPPPLPDALPRMDVAVFVGFASTGPLHLPVVVESVSQFDTVFGGDAPLAWDEARGERVTAFLAPGVRAFFSNGGRRCWVIRVARTAALEALRDPASTQRVATSNAFAMPGVLELGGDGAVTAALAQARCEGSWSDPLRVRTALSRQSFVIELAAASSPATTVQFHTHAGLRAGDVVELEAAPHVTTFATIEDVRAARAPGAAYIATATPRVSFERIQSAASPAGSALAGHATVRGFVDDAALFEALPDEGSARIHFVDAVATRLERGHWVRWSDGVSRIWLRIDSIERAPVFGGSPPAEPPLIDAAVSGAAWLELDTVALPADTRTRAHVLSLDLHADDDARTARRVRLGLTPRHAGSWWSHVTDAAFYAPGDDAAVSGAERLIRSDVQRFPLARADGPLPIAWLPLGVAPLFGAALAPLPQASTALERDGLARFDASLFLDPELARVTMHGLTDVADAIRFLRDDARELLGLHGALSVGRGGLFNEGSLLAIPDAVHVGWQRRVDPAVPVPQPPPAVVPPHWSAHRGPCAAEGAAPIDEPDFSRFLDCDTRALAAPVLFGPAAAIRPGVFQLSWTSAEQDAEYVLYEAMQPDFADSREIARGYDTEHVALAPRDGIYFYRVYAGAAGEQSAGSNIVVVRVRQDEWVQQDTSAYGDTFEQECLAVHRAALRLAAAGGDLLTVLALPRHFRTQDAVRYTQRLRSVNEPFAARDAAAFDFTEARALSYGALYFPWLQSDGRGTIVPPDGAAAGVLAARASRRGAWVAPANEPLVDVVALTPSIPPADWQQLQATQLNILRNEPRGFLTLSADTLALEPELRLINVRRLLILLRRLALRRGHSYVFEPLGPTLRRAVQRGFELLLTDMFRRGAFAGASVAQSFRVVTDNTVNMPRDAAAGRFVVELRVAPSVPLSFLTVRLAQSGSRLTVSEEL